jgi:NADPH:quinone reductase-like Zn-dependent oxidoreductase
METMKAIRIHTFGGTEVLQYEDIPIPTINSDEFLIRIFIAGVNPIDWKVREGYRQDVLRHSLPLILGWDFSGMVAAVGSATTAFKLGDAVYGHPSMLRNGAYAEYIAVKENEIAFKPIALDYVDAAVVPLSALTAWQALFDIAHLAPGQKILIHAAAGGVGHYAVQLAKWKGAYVIGTASNKNKSFLSDLGVDEFIDYTTTPFEKIINNVDVVFDTVGGETQMKSWSVLKKNGILVSIVDPKHIDEQAAKFDVRGRYFVVSSNPEQLLKITELIDLGFLKPHIETIFSLENAAKAHRLLQTGHVTGKIALVVSS